MRRRLVDAVAVAIGFGLLAVCSHVGSMQYEGLLP